MAEFSFLVAALVPRWVSSVFHPWLIYRRGRIALGVNVVETVDRVREEVAQARLRGLTIALVPTMGALHEGHGSLLRAARGEAGFVVATIFVNPAQFGPHEDFERYPRTWEADLQLCQREGVELVFAPPVSLVYPAGFQTYVEVHGLQEVMCGLSRPNHFRGVATVVLKLFHMVGPDFAYFGQKDFQQARIIEQLVADLNLSVQVRVCPIIRDQDGLALSSRNKYLDPDQRRHATILYQALREAKNRVHQGERDPVALQIKMAEMVVQTPGASLDYAVVVDAHSLQPLERLKGKVLLALAVRFGATRLIDNVVVELIE